MKNSIPLMLLPCLALLACSNGGDSGGSSSSSSAVFICRDSYTDMRDGKSYRMCWDWMLENANYNSEGSKCYNNDPANCDKYGRLYTWQAAKKACPEGWPLPAAEQWQKLAALTGGSLAAGKTLKSKTGWGWDGNSGGTDDYGFSVLPGGYGYSDGFSGIGEYSYFWSKEENGGNAVAYIISASSDYLSRAEFSKTEYMFSVRCVTGF
jgi:uncharacterized protein (TIGR02145 family)